MKMPQALWLTLGCWLPLAHAQAPDTHAVLRQCRALADAAARLACYDQLPLPAVPPANPPAAPAVAAVAGPMPAVAPAAFGLPRTEDPVQAVTSQIPGLFEGWGPKDLIRLANGQVWQVSDDSRAVYRLRDPKVTVRRAPFGTFVLDIEGANQVPRVRRVQ